MRQKLPDAAPERLYVNDIGRIVGPGEEFDAPHLVPGAVPLEPPEPAEGTEAPPLASGAAPGDESPQDPSGPADDTSPPAARLPARQRKQGA